VCCVLCVVCVCVCVCVCLLVCLCGCVFFVCETEIVCCSYNCFMQVFEDSYKSPYSCVIVDDIERLLGKK